MLTKEQINSIRHVVTCDDLHLTECACAELRRLALLGLEREESRARVEAGIEAERHVESSVLADSFGAFPDLEPEPERDERAERVGRAVLRELSDQGVELPGLRDGYASEGGIIAVIAAAMEGEA